MTRVRLSLGALGLLALAACAKMAPPPGGLEDRDPPVVLGDALRPGPGAAAVAPDSTVVIVFSERTDHRSVMTALTTIPPVDFARIDWRGDTLMLRPEGGWAAERNTVIRITGSARDRRGNEMGGAFQTTFTTKAVADSGEITGRVWAGRELEPPRQLVVIAWSADDSTSERWPAAIADATSGGKFTLRKLDTARSWQLAGVIDADGDLQGDGEGETEAAWPEPILFPSGQTSVEVDDFLVGSLDSLGTIQGEVKVDSARVAFLVAERAEVVAPPGAVADGEGSAQADTVASAAELDGPVAETEAPAEATAPDSLAAPRHRWLESAPWSSGPSRDGEFTISVPTGDDYRVGAFVDVDGDSVLDASEPRVVLDRVLSLRLVSGVQGVRFDLRGLAPWPAGAVTDSSEAAVAPEEEEEIGE